MLKIIVCSLLLWSSLSIGEEAGDVISTECDHLGVITLMSMGLEPQFENGECPSSWKWPEQKENECHYMGKYYKHGEDFIKKDSNSETSCKCNVRKGNRRIICEPTNWTSLYEPYNEEFKCENGKYFGNQVFWPENTCLQCVCKPGYNGKFVAPFCKHNSMDIGFQFQKEISQNCTPYYYNYYNSDKPALCSPTGFICNEEIYEISPINVVKDPTDSKMCTIDNELHPKGTALNVTFINYNSKTNVNCTCLSPPLFTCVNNYILHIWTPIAIPYGAVDNVNVAENTLLGAKDVISHITKNNNN